MSDGEPRALAVDLGSTRFKAGCLHTDGRLEPLLECATPPLSVDGAIHEGDAGSFVDAARGLLARLLAATPERLPLGLAVQRSTFALVDPAGRVVSPLISWRDTRAADWCERNRSFEAEFHAATGLMLSAHYVGPKLAALAEADASVRDGLRRGTLRLRLLDGLVLAALGETGTDASMAARTGLYELAAGDWSEALCARFGVDPACLPALRPTDGLAIPLAGGATLRACLADQSAVLLSRTGARRETLLVNLGTGGFVLRAVGAAPLRRPRYLTALLRRGADGAASYALEGAIGGSGPAIDAHRASAPDLEAGDPAPELYALPDGAGLGAPYWRPQVRLTFSSGAAPAPELAYRALLEGLLFRVREIHDDLVAGDAPPRRVVLAGGLAREPFVAHGLATLLDREIELPDAADATLLGAACAAAEERPRDAAARRVDAGRGAYLRDKYGRWRAWLDGLLA